MNKHSIIPGFFALVIALAGCATALAKAYGAVAVKLNGPRYWVIDLVVGGGSTLTGNYADFGGIQMKLLARVAIDPSQVSSGNARYQPSGVSRTTAYTYRAGRKVYELVSPTGEPRHENPRHS